MEDPHTNTLTVSPAFRTLEQRLLHERFAVLDLLYAAGQQPEIPVSWEVEQEQRQYDD